MIGIIILNFPLNIIILYMLVTFIIYPIFIYAFTSTIYIHHLVIRFFVQFLLVMSVDFQEGHKFFSREKRCPHLQNINSFYFFFFLSFLQKHFCFNEVYFQNKVPKSGLNEYDEIFRRVSTKYV